MPNSQCAIIVKDIPNLMLCTHLCFRDELVFVRSECLESEMTDTPESVRSAVAVLVRLLPLPAYRSPDTEKKVTTLSQKLQCSN